MAGRRVNVNVGVLGHIDSGKTALARALSTTASTAAFDKQPQSRERGITLDLGFSCFSVPLPERLRPAPQGTEPEYGAELQITLVDCPGHASLIRTIIGGEHRRRGRLAGRGARRGSPSHHPSRRGLSRNSESVSFVPHVFVIHARVRATQDHRKCPEGLHSLPPVSCFPGLGASLRDSV